MKHVIVLFDIDNTLINFDLSVRQKTVEWFGGSASVWKYYLKDLKEAAKTKNIDVHFGIATFKPEFSQPVATPNDAESKEIPKKLRGDDIFGAVVEDEAWIALKDNSKLVGVESGAGIKEFLDEKLIFLTNGACKTVNALVKAKDEIEKRYQQKIDAKNVWIADDVKSVQSTAEEAGFSSADASSMLSQGKYGEQKQAIRKLFATIYQSLELELPPEPEPEARDNLFADPKVYRESQARIMAALPKPAGINPALLAQARSLDDDDEAPASAAAAYLPQERDVVDSHNSSMQMQF